MVLSYIICVAGEMSLNMQESLLLSKEKEKICSINNSKDLIRFRSKYLSAGFVRSLAWKIVRTVIILGLCYLILYPFIIKITNAVKPYNEFMDPTIRFISKHPTMDNINRVIEKMNFFEALKNTAVISIITAVIQTAISALVGYGFARYNFKGNKILFALVIFTLIVPPETIIMPLFLQFRFFIGFINLINTPLPMVILSLTALGLRNGLYIFMFRQYYKNVPKELDEASCLDGCNAFQTFVKIMLPPSIPIIVTILLLSFSWQWTDTVYSALFFNNMPFLSNLINGVGEGESIIQGSNYVQIASLLSILPVAVVYVFAQKFFVQSIERTGLVG